VRVRYTPQAGQDLAEIFDFIARDKPDAATRTIDRVAQLVDLLARVFFGGRRVRGTREMIVPNLPYIVIYRVRRDAVEIISVVRGARRR
jgi:addiction module RelE/StbE family toxin